MKFIKHQYNCLFLSSVLFALLFTGCSKMLEVNPPINEIVGQNVYSSPHTATALLTGIFAKMSENSFASGDNSISINLAQYADESIPSRDPNSFYNNSLRSIDDPYWTQLYEFIFRANSAIEGIQKSELRDVVKNQLIGEAKFIRSFCYFYLVNLFGDVPLLTTTDYKINAEAPRVDTSLVYDFIIQDLKEARTLINTNYVSVSDLSTPVTDRARPNKATITALLARVYLYTHQWEKAEEEATAIISNTTNYSLLPLADLFRFVEGQHNKEAIWQLQPVSYFREPNEGRLLMPARGIPFFYLSNYIYQTFEPNDNRKAIWTSTESVDVETFVSIVVGPFACKYKTSGRPGVIPSQYLIVFRVAEQYLIRAEARVQQDKLIPGKNDLDAIRLRAGLTESPAASKSELLDAIIDERRCELFTEFGHRWFDLKRTGKAHAVLSAHKQGGWQQTDLLLPIPAFEIDRNKSLQGHQNPGY